MNIKRVLFRNIKVHLIKYRITIVNYKTNNISNQVVNILTQQIAIC